ncbi:tetratricopeptide repeat protein [Akkermansia muciniphila]|uniref:tetratricopeptide repeat protein n=1 Tax=Akkermansia muciniphila TaxID=239935 RepID=UPI001BFF57FE|nr:tetratricopeptide repeat protein [Akkermansia muciniphila]MBT8777369.1 tetratricopeptide repeat protein [Akkermansia muciniphila]
MRAHTFLLAALVLALLPASAQQPAPATPAPAWVQEFNSLPEASRKSYIDQFRRAEQLFAQKRTMECLFSLTELEKIYAGNPGLYNLRGACYIEIRNVEKALENFEKALKLDPSNLTIQFNLAEARYVSHDYAGAMKAFTELLPSFKDNPGMTSLLQFKRYICARKLDDQALARELESLYGPMDDTPYYYCTQAIIKFLGGDKDAAQEQLLSAIRIHGGTSAMQAFTDAMTEAGILPSPYGQTVPTAQPEKTGLEKNH